MSLVNDSNINILEDKLGTKWLKLLIVTAVKVGVPNLETDLFTNVNKLFPSCNT